MLELWRTRLVAWKRNAFSDIYQQGGIEIHLAIRGEYDRKGYPTFSYAKDLVLEPLLEGQVVEKPLLYLTATEAQTLMDSLWDCGLRPSEGAGSAGAMQAVQNHLKEVQADKIFLHDIVAFTVKRGGSNG